MSQKSSKHILGNVSETPGASPCESGHAATARDTAACSASIVPTLAPADAVCHAACLPAVRFLARLTAIDIENDIIAAGFRAVILDVDNTILPRDGQGVPADIDAWIARVKAAGIPICLLSNNWHEPVRETAQRYDLPLVVGAVKPLPFGFWRALSKLKRGQRGNTRAGGPADAFADNPDVAFAAGAPADTHAAGTFPNAPRLRRRTTLVIGDQLITDVWGARIAGFRVILVNPLCEADLWHTLALRRLERAILKQKRTKGE